MKYRSIVVFAVVCAILMIALAAAQAQDPSGPALGDTIDLTSFRSQKGQTLAEAIKGHSLAMIVLVSPNCDTCSLSKDGFKNLKAEVAQPGIPYFVLMISDGSDSAKYYSYADSLKLGAESFVWSNAEAKPPISLASMAVPSHLMVTNEGLVVNKWLGAEAK